MKTTLISIIATAVITCFVCSFVFGLKTGIERLWLISAVKAPGRMALDEISNDLAQGRCDVAKAKIEVLQTEWQRFNLETNFQGQAIGDIMVKFSKMNQMSPPVTGLQTNLTK